MLTKPLPSEPLSVLTISPSRSQMSREMVLSVVALTSNWKIIDKVHMRLFCSIKDILSLQ